MGKLPIDIKVNYLPAYQYHSSFALPTKANKKKAHRISVRAPHVHTEPLHINLNDILLKHVRLMNGI